jgi:hypothetical protein
MQDARDMATIRAMRARIARMVQADEHDARRYVARRRDIERAMARRDKYTTRAR